MSDESRGKIRWMVQSHHTCVLATASEGRPHCSLMAYAADEACSEIYMVTHRTTRKYKNLITNPHISLLIDSREDHPGKGLSQAKALTVTGEYEPIRDEKKRRSVEERLAAVHPDLRDFMAHEDAEVFLVKVTSFLMLEGLSDTHYEEV